MTFGEFQSTPPVRGATADVVYDEARTVISIHAPRAGGDCGSPEHTEEDHYFNPRPPCGGRRCFRIIDGGFKRFQSTPPVRGATEIYNSYPDEFKISIHAPRAGGVD